MSADQKNGQKSICEPNLVGPVDVLRAIQKVVRCHSCRKPLRSTRVCRKGHGICHPCKSRSRTCPVCKARITKTKPVMLDRIIKLLPRPCRFSQEGCESLVLEDTDHEIFCGHRQAECRLRSFGWVGKVLELQRHLETVHKKELVCAATEAFVLTSFNTRDDREGLSVIAAYDNVFWQHARVVKGRLFQVFQYVPTEKPQERFDALVTYCTPETNYSSATPVHTDAFDLQHLFMDKETFCLPRKVATSFSKNHIGGVHCYVEIIRKPL